MREFHVGGIGQVECAYRDLFRTGSVATGGPPDRTASAFADLSDPERIRTAPTGEDVCGIRDIECDLVGFVWGFIFRVRPDQCLNISLRHGCLSSLIYIFLYVPSQQAYGSASKISTMKECLSLCMRDTFKF